MFGDHFSFSFLLPSLFCSFARIFLPHWKKPHGSSEISSPWGFITGGFHLGILTGLKGPISKLLRRGCILYQYWIMVMCHFRGVFLLSCALFPGLCRTEGQPLPEHQRVPLKSLLPFQGLRSGEDTSSLSSPPGSIQFVLCLTALIAGGGSLVPTKGSSLLFLPSNSQAAATPPLPGSLCPSPVLS